MKKKKLNLAFILNENVQIYKFEFENKFSLLYSRKNPIKPCKVVYIYIELYFKITSSVLLLFIIKSWHIDNKKSCRYSRYPKVSLIVDRYWRNLRFFFSEIYCIYRLNIYTIYFSMIYSCFLICGLNICCFIFMIMCE